MRPPSLRMAITTSHLLRVASASAAAISFLASSSVSAGFIRIRVFPLVPLVSSLGRGPKRSSVEALGERFVQNLLGLSRDTGDDLAGGEDVGDEAGILSHREHGLLGVAVATGSLQGGVSIRTALPQRPFPSGPARDEAIASGARHRARPDDTGRNIRDL